MEFLIHFSLGFILSFIGSLPLGIINMTVAETAIKKGFKAGLMIAIGASFVELIQAFIALKFTWIFVENPAVESALDIIALIVFWGLGLYYFFIAQPAQPKGNKEEENSKMSGFLKGMAVSSVNVLVFPYWIFYGTYLTTNGWMQMEDEFVYTFVIGVMMGTFTLLFLYAKLGLLITNRAERLTSYVNKFIGLVFIAFGIYQACKTWGGH
ncbi:MAG: LysE family translocator [Bacteroidetes bacterium]|nr:LysE family translocator [Bacteroidota bacterium]MDF1863246.1 LysE family transporter [Saprospiraceae bacterium]